MDADKKKIWVSGQTIEVTDAVYEAYILVDGQLGQEKHRLQRLAEHRHHGSGLQECEP